MKRVSWFSQAFSRLSNTHTQSSQPNSRRRSRHLKRRALLENLETRQLLAAGNGPPVVVGGWIDLQHNAPHQISVADLDYSDADNDPITSLTVQTLPTLGTLELYGYPVYAGQEVYAWDIQFGSFNYVPTGDAGTSYSASFSFSVSDGWDSSASTASLGFQVTVTPNSPPTIAGSNHPLSSPQSHTLTIADLGYSDPDGDPLQSITIHATTGLGIMDIPSPVAKRFILMRFSGDS